MRAENREARCAGGAPRAGLAWAVLLAGLLGSAAATAGTAYVPLGAAGRIAVIDTGRDVLAGTIDGIGNVHALAVTPDGRYLVAGSIEEHAGTVPPRPAGMSQSEHEAHHRGGGGGTAGAAMSSHVSVIDVRARRALRRVTVPGMVHHIALLPDGAHAVAVHTTRGAVSVVSVAHGHVVRTVLTGPAPNYAVVSRDGRRVYVSNTGNDTVSEVDTERWVVLRNFLVGKAPEHLALSPDGGRLYVLEVGDGRVAELDTASGRVLRRFAVGRAPHGVAVTPDGRTLLATAKGGDRLVAVDLATGRRREVGLAPAPYHLALVDGEKVYVTSRKAPVVWVLDARTLKVRGEIRLPAGEGHQIAVHPGG